MPHLRLTPELHRTMVSYIRSGCYDWLAAEAAGVPRGVFEDWLRRGQAGARAYRAFARDIAQARAQARAAAEISAHRSDPLFWLRHGPGRETPATPGWTVPVRPLVSAAQVSALESLSVLQLLRVLDEALRHHPEAQSAVLQAIDRLQAHPTSRRKTQGETS